MKKEVYSLIESARSVRVYDGDVEIPRETLEYLVDCARITPSAANMQPLKYKICCERDVVEKLQPLTRWAGYIKDRTLPPEGKCPAAFIVICHDETVSQPTAFSHMDIGIAAQSINLASREEGLGTCMIGSFDKDALKALLGIPESCIPMLIIAIGVPLEFPVLCSVDENGSIKYYRDERDKHFVPKRSLEEVLL